MKVRKVINNNIVSSADEDGREIVVMGRGIGFQAREGWEIPEERIEKIFRLDNKDSLNRFKDLLARLPLEHIQISDEIISYGKKVLNKPLNHNIYITLTDHINFAVERHRQNMMFPNPLLREVRSFYREEYLIGEYALALIKKKLGIDFPVDEAASIALHLVNAEYNTAMRDTINSNGSVFDYCCSGIVFCMACILRRSCGVRYQYCKSWRVRIWYLCVLEPPPDSFRSPSRFEFRILV